MTHSIAGPQFLPLTTAYVSRGPTGRLKADRAHLSTGPSHARPRGGLLGVVPSPQPVALLASRRAIKLDAYQAIASTIPSRASNKVKRALFNEIATPGDGACDGRLPLRIDQTNVQLARLCRGGSACPHRLHANQAINPSSQPPSQVFAGHYVDYNPYDPISYAQNNTGRGGGR
jgi:hypothetical protein